MPTTQLHKFRVSFDHSEEFHRLKREIFTNHQYYFETDQPAPRIIDAGAHIGMATLYFKQLYPDAQVIAIEPHPRNFALLSENVADNGLNDVHLIQAALADQVGTRALFADETDEQWLSTASFSAGAWNGQQLTQPLTVETLPLHALLHQPVELLKMDVEGAELLILLAAKNQLRQINRLVLEFHPHRGQSWSQLVRLLQDQGFELTAWQDQESFDLDDTPKRLTLLWGEQRRPQ